MVGDILQPTHLLFILVVALLVLGPKRLPEVGRTLGSGLRDFRQAINGESHDRDEHEPHGYVETESNVDTGPAFADEEPSATAVEEHDDAGWTPDPETDTGPAFATDDAESAFATDDADTGAATGTASDEDVLAEPTPTAEHEPAPSRTTASSSGFASALAASRRQPGNDTADDE
ncbi:MAG TPA: twin-arginine translocase TatA/TatE family subunit [Solirubrobacteraceae bacterium]|nr:twin-arginine translocase TatA/TatE family subunit [Solirubrobacteraceae bacterium]